MEQQKHSSRGVLEKSYSWKKACGKVLSLSCSLQLHWKRTPLQVYFNNFCKKFQKSHQSYSVKHLQTAASERIACNSKADWKRSHLIGKVLHVKKGAYYHFLWTLQQYQFSLSLPIPLQWRLWYVHLQRENFFEIIVFSKQQQQPKLFFIWRKVYVKRNATCVKVAFPGTYL